MNVNDLKIAFVPHCLKLIKSGNWDELTNKLKEAGRWEGHALYLTLNKYHKPLWNKSTNEIRYMITELYDLAQESL